MTFLVEVQHRLTVVQGLPSPVRARRGLPPMPPGITLVVTAGVTATQVVMLTREGWCEFSVS